MSPLVRNLLFIEAAVVVLTLPVVVTGVLSAEWWATRT